MVFKGHFNDVKVIITCFDQASDEAISYRIEVATLDYESMEHCSGAVTLCMRLRYPEVGNIPAAAAAAVTSSRTRRTVGRSDEFGRRGSTGSSRVLTRCERRCASNVGSGSTSNVGSGSTSNVGSDSASNVGSGSTSNVGSNSTSNGVRKSTSNGGRRSRSRSVKRRCKWNNKQEGSEDGEETIVEHPTGKSTESSGEVFGTSHENQQQQLQQEREEVVVPTMISSDALLQSSMPSYGPLNCAIPPCPPRIRRGHSMCVPAPLLSFENMNSSNNNNNSNNKISSSVTSLRKRSPRNQPVSSRTRLSAARGQLEEYNNMIAGQLCNSTNGGLFLGQNQHHPPHIDAPQTQTFPTCPPSPSRIMRALPAFVSPDTRPSPCRAKNPKASKKRGTTQPRRTTSSNIPNEYNNEQSVTVIPTSAHLIHTDAPRTRPSPRRTKKNPKVTRQRVPTQNRTTSPSLPNENNEHDDVSQKSATIDHTPHSTSHAPSPRLTCGSALVSADESHPGTLSRPTNNTFAPLMSKKRGYRQPRSTTSLPKENIEHDQVTPTSATSDQQIPHSTSTSHTPSPADLRSTKSPLVQSRTSTLPPPLRAANTPKVPNEYNKHAVAPTSATIDQQTPRTSLTPSHTENQPTNALSVQSWSSTLPPPPSRASNTPKVSKTRETSSRKQHPTSTLPRKTTTSSATSLNKRRHTGHRSTATAQDAHAHATKRSLPAQGSRNAPGMMMDHGGNQWWCLPGTHGGENHQMEATPTVTTSIATVTATPTVAQTTTMYRHLGGQHRPREERGVSETTKSASTSNGSHHLLSTPSQWPYGHSLLQRGRDFSKPNPNTNKRSVRDINANSGVDINGNIRNKQQHSNKQHDENTLKNKQHGKKSKNQWHGKSIKICSVASCSTKFVGYVIEWDESGPPGPRCSRHGGRGRCSLAKCDQNSVGKVTMRDAYGSPGRRCKRHGGRGMCSVPNCRNYNAGHVFVEDAFGSAGGRCPRHGGGLRCSVPGCKTPSRGKVDYPDAYGEPGCRCCRHGGGARCTVPGCGNSSVGKTQVADVFGEPGQRCKRHGGGMRCSVAGCTTSSEGALHVADVFGPAGQRCCRHGGGHRCSVPACTNASQGRMRRKGNMTGVLVERRCKRHGGRKRQEEETDKEKERESEDR